MSNSTTIQGPRSGSEKFRPKVRLLKLIGDELISDEATAIVELVKNAYDADATRVEICFEADAEGVVSQIVISDDGNGMGLETVLGPWLEPGTLNKERNSTSPKGRVLQGAKGIGRFAVSRLAETVTMETTDFLSGRTTTVLIDWGKFDEDTPLSDIEVLYEEAAKQNRTSGTTLTLEKVKKRWSLPDFKSIENRLERLVSPFEGIEDFEIHLSYPNSGPGTVLTSAADNLVPPYELTGSVTAGGLFTGSASVELPDGSKRKFDFSSEQLQLPEKKASEPALPFDPDTCGPFQIQVRAFDRGSGELEKLKSQTIAEIGTLKGIRDLLDDRCGMSLYRDGIRVYPYGQPGDDWLQLDKRRFMKPVLRLSNNQIIGAVRIERSLNPGLIDRSSREGLIRNAAFDDLRAKAIAVLELIEAKRYESRKEKGALKVTPRAQPVFSALTLKPALDRLRQEVQASDEVIAIVEEADEQLKEGVERVQDLYSTLLASAGLGHLVDLVIHEIGNPLGKAVLKTESIRKTVTSEVPDPPKEKLLLALEDLKTHHSQIHALRGRLDPNTAAKRGRATSFDVREEVTATLELFEAVISKAKIEVVTDLPSTPLMVKMNRSALSQTLANLCDNALYWMTRPDSPENKKLLLSVFTTQAGFEVRVSDSGMGVLESVKEHIFDPYFSTKPDGMGLGLHISRLVTEPYGTVELAPTAELGGATFVATFLKGLGSA